MIYYLSSISQVVVDLVHGHGAYLCSLDSRTNAHNERFHVESHSLGGGVLFIYTWPPKPDVHFGCALAN